MISSELVRVQRMIRRLRNRIAPKGLVLLYHRVVDLESDPQAMSVSPENFEEQLGVLRDTYHLIDLLQMTRSLEDGINDRSVSLTFDDGYADNLDNAKPILSKYDIPGCVFVATGNEREFWWDVLERIFLNPGELPRELLLKVDGHQEKLDLGNSVDYKQGDFQRWRKWTIHSPRDPTPRHRIYRSLCNLLQSLDPGQREKAIIDIQNWSGSEKDERMTHRTLLPGEIAELAKGGLIEVGAHSENHPVLSSLTPEDQLREIQENKSYLENILGHKISCFSYPFGSKRDYSDTTIGIAKKLGFSCCCTTYADLVWKLTNPMKIPRMTVRNWNGEKFREILESWFHG